MEGSQIKSLLIVAGLFLIGGGLVLALSANVTQVTTTQLLGPATTVTNQSIALSNGTMHLLTNTRITSITSVANQTLTLTSGNYTLSAGDDGSSLNITIFGCSCANMGANLNVTYVYLPKTIASLSAANATGGIGQFSAQLPLIGIIMAITVVILILFTILFPRFQGGGKE